MSGEIITCDQECVVNSGDFQYTGTDPAMIKYYADIMSCEERTEGKNPRNRSVIGCRIKEKNCSARCIIPR